MPILDDPPVPGCLANAALPLALRPSVLFILCGLIITTPGQGLGQPEALPTRPAVLETPHVRFTLDPRTGAYEIVDRQGGVVWRSNPNQKRFGQATLEADGKTQRADLGGCEVDRTRRTLELAWCPVPSQPTARLRASIAVVDGERALQFSVSVDRGLTLQSIRLLDEAFWVTDKESASIAVPVREGMLIPADSGLTFSHGFDTYAYEGCHMAMLGVIKQGAALLMSWQDPYVLAEVKSTRPDSGPLAGRQVLSPSIVCRNQTATLRVDFLGRGDHVRVASAYRALAKERGWLVTWKEKVRGHAERARLHGAINYKLWSTLDRSMNEESTKEQSSKVNWTFTEAAQVAEHLSRDLKLDRVLFLMGGWIHRGYDNQHPDILPAAPECGGNEGFEECARRIRRLGYVFGLHDNYQDMYRDAPSWDEGCLMKSRDGSLAKGGHWAGGRAYLTCSRKAVELAKRPQNLPAVKRLTNADAYFIDTTYAAGLQECFDPNHPLTRADDMKWKQVISDYARDEFGIFGSECGREWAIPHCDFFEGLTGVSGAYYHDTGLLKKVGGVPVPLFEVVYRDCIAMYGKYGYEPSLAAQYVLHHIAIGRPLHYHNIPAHLYWLSPAPGQGDAPLPLRASVSELTQTGPRQFRVSFLWTVSLAPKGDWRAFVHFTDASGAIQFQADYAPAPETSVWRPGQVVQGPFTVTVPEGLQGAFDVRAGLFQPESNQRAQLLGRHDGERRFLLGKVKVDGEKIEFEGRRVTPASFTGDPAVFVHADGGWAEGLHPLDRFVKNTYEILSPLNEITAESPMTGHAFLNPERTAQRSVFGEGRGRRNAGRQVEAVVNGGEQPLTRQSRLGGQVVLPPYGFLIESPTFIAFHASSWGGLDYAAPVLFCLRSLDGKPIENSRKVRIYHGFGDSRIRLSKKEWRVPREEIVSSR